jgi:hypothetical protein
MSDRLIDQAPDMFCHRLARIDALGPNRRVIFTIPSIDGDHEDVVVKLVLPADFMVTLAYMAVGAEQHIAPELLALEPRNAN